MQRTGGTALTDMLFTMSEHKKTDHEPFHWGRPPRQFWPIISAWRETEDPDQLNFALDDVFSNGYLIKHTYELNEHELNEYIMYAAARANYKHIMLLRRDEYSRLMSKFIAESQGTWFHDYAKQVFDEVTAGTRDLSALPIDKMVEHYRFCRSATTLMRDSLISLGKPFKEIYYEDIYSGPDETRLSNTYDLLDFIGFTADDISNHKSLIESTIFRGGQNSRNLISFLPNMREVNSALAAEGCLPMPAEQLEAAPPPPPPTPGPRAKIRAEVERLITHYKAKGPILEIATDVHDLVVTSQEVLPGQPRHVVGLGNRLERENVTFHDGDSHDMTSAFPDGAFGVVISNRAVPRDKKFWRTQDEIRRVLAPGGLLILVAPCFSVVPNDAGVVVVGAKGNPVDTVTITRKINGSPDFWRISPQAVKNVLFDGFEIKEVHVKLMPPNVFGVGVKGS
jgi:hypothetical protein